jgi:polysaccharide biosynthesis transport protein
MQLNAYLAILWRRKWVILITAAATLIVAGIGTLLIAPKYAGSATLRIPLSSSVGGETVRSSDLLYADRLMNTYEQIAMSQPVLHDLAQKLGRDTAPKVEIAILANTELMRITAMDPDPAVAAKAANEMANILISQGRQLYMGAGKTSVDILGAQLAQMEQDISQARSDYEKLAVQESRETEQVTAARRLLELREATYGRLLEQYERARANQSAQENTISLVEPAMISNSPSSPNTPLILGLALLAGLVAGVGLAFLFENLDSTLYTTEKIEQATQLPILGQIPPADLHGAGAFLTSTAVQEDVFRRIRVTLMALDHDPPLKTLLVTSAEPGVGKSMIVANLARAIAQTGRRVLVVDGDMRSSRLQEIFGVPNEVGLSSILSQTADLDAAVQTSNVPGVQILTSGPLPSNPAELLGSTRIRDGLRQLAQAYDMVLVDGPAINSVADAEELAVATDGVILVVRRAQSREDAVRNAYKHLVILKARPIGIIVNSAGGKTTTTTTRQRLERMSNSATRTTVATRMATRQKLQRMSNAIRRTTSATRMAIEQIRQPIGNSIKASERRWAAWRRGAPRIDVPLQAAGEASGSASSRDTAILPLQTEDEASAPTLSRVTVSLPLQMESEVTGSAPSWQTASLPLQPEEEATGQVSAPEPISTPEPIGARTQAAGEVMGGTTPPEPSSLLAQPDGEATRPAQSQETASLWDRADGEAAAPAATGKAAGPHARRSSRETRGRSNKTGPRRVSPKPSR